MTYWNKYFFEKNNNVAILIVLYRTEIQANVRILGLRMIKTKYGVV